MWQRLFAGVPLALKIAKALAKPAAIIIVVLAVAYFIYVVFRVGLPTFLSDPARQFFVPQVPVTPTTYVEVGLWDHESWLTSEEARDLREITNVVNLAFLEDGQALYSRDHGVVFSQNATWQKVNPIALQSLSVDGTAVTIKLNGHEYGLNTYQPFVNANYPTMILIVDASGVVWGQILTPTLLVDLNAAVSALPLEVAPNPNLSFTY